MLEKLLPPPIRYPPPARASAKTGAKTMTAARKSAAHRPDPRHDIAKFPYLIGMANIWSPVPILQQQVGQFNSHSGACPWGQAT
jgi:hypothetical protein